MCSQVLGCSSCRLCAPGCACPACLQRGSGHACGHGSASLECAETKTGCCFHQQVADCSRRLRKKKQNPRAQRGDMQGWSWMIWKGGEETLLKEWAGWSVIHIPSFLSTCSLAWEGSQMKADKLFGYPILLQCSPATCVTKYTVQGGSHKNRRDISEIRVSAPPDLYPSS